MKISFHVIRSLPLGNPNRGQSNEPKWCYFGGCERGRISSQSQNSALRRWLMEAIPALCSGVRTAHLSDMVASLAKENEDLKADAPRIGQRMVGLFRKDGTKEKTQMMFFAPGEINAYALAAAAFQKEQPESYKKWLDPEAVLGEMLGDALAPFTDDEDVEGEFDEATKESIIKNATAISNTLAATDGAPNFSIDNPTDEFVEFVVARLRELREAEDQGEFKKIVKAKQEGRQPEKAKGGKKPNGRSTANGEFRKVLDKQLALARKDPNRRMHALDIALMGRMLHDHIDGVSGALTTAHAITVHPLQGVEDFFSAYDDYSHISEHIGGDDKGKMLHASVFYQYHSLNLACLRQDYPPTHDFEADILRAITMGIYRAVPEAMSRKTATAHARPSAILIEVIPNGIPITFANAFERPVSSGPDGGYIAKAVAELVRHASFHVGEQHAETKRFWLSAEGHPCEAAGLDGKKRQLPGLTVVSSVDDLAAKVAEAAR